MEKVDKPDDKFFKKAFENVDNVRLFLKRFLPTSIRDAIDIEGMALDNSNYVSDHLKESLADLVVKTTIKTKSKERSQTDIYILMEHKSYRDSKVLVQMLMYMALMWQKDVNEKKPLRVILPYVFYHGEEKWTVPHSFVEQFNVEDEIKGFLLDYRYLLFDTWEWDMSDSSNEEIRKNYFLFSALALMKHVQNMDLSGIESLFRYWSETGFIHHPELFMVCLLYISEKKDMEPEELKKLFEKSKIDGGEIMPTLAQRWIDEGKQYGRKEGRQEGERLNKLEIARNMLLRDYSIEEVAVITGLKEEEIKRLIN